MSVKNYLKYFFDALCQNKKPPSVFYGQWLRAIPFAGKALSAKADNDDNANADKNISNGHRSAVKCRIKFVVRVTHQLWLPAISKTNTNY